MTKRVYEYNSKVQLTKNINVKEIRCKGAVQHSTIVANNHPEKVQNFMDCYGYTKVIINSGYRCKAHDKKVGGSGSGQHTKGTAMDVKFYKDNKAVSAEIVCCNAQDFGFKGVAYIGTNWTHLDSRSVGTYRGDERRGRSNNVGGDFYKYFNRPANQLYVGIFPTLPTRGYFKKGDSGLEVMKLQCFLNWSIGAKLTVDGILGKGSEKAIKKFQTKVGIKADGLFGKNSLAKAKTYRK